MFLGKRLKELREDKELLQRQLAANLEIDTPMYSKIERGERRAKREQVIMLAELLEADQDELLTLWLAGQVNELVKHEALAGAVLELVKNNLKN